MSHGLKVFRCGQIEYKSGTTEEHHNLSEPNILIDTNRSNSKQQL